MNNIRIQSQNVVIRVNDDETDNTIVLDFDNGDFENKFYTLVDRIEKKTEELDKKASELGELTRLETAKYIAKFTKEMSEFLSEEIDIVFGENTCKKVFGIEKPHYSKIITFMEELKPYFENYRKELTKKFNKYNPERIGNV